MIIVLILFVVMIRDESGVTVLAGQYSTRGHVTPWVQSSRALVSRTGVSGVQPSHRTATHQTLLSHIQHNITTGHTILLSP